jgi:hypothetical protein
MPGRAKPERGRRKRTVLVSAEAVLRRIHVSDGEGAIGARPSDERSDMDAGHDFRCEEFALLSCDRRLEWLGPNNQVEGRADKSLAMFKPLTGASPRTPG